MNNLTQIVTLLQIVLALLSSGKTNPQINALAAQAISEAQVALATPESPAQVNFQPTVAVSASVPVSIFGGTVTEATDTSVTVAWQSNTNTSFSLAVNGIAYPSMASNDGCTGSVCSYSEVVGVGPIGYSTEDSIQILGGGALSTCRFSMPSFRHVISQVSTCK